MSEEPQESYTAFEEGRRVASGTLADVAAKIKESIGRRHQSAALVFDDATGRVIDVDLHGSMREILVRLEKSGEEAPPVAQRQKGPGRPRLGVVSREVTLLPRHWEWLSKQPGGASVALRKLVDEARRANRETDAVRESREAAYRFMSAMAGDLPGFEEASRALFAGDRSRFTRLTRSWPEDIRDYTRRLARAGLRKP
ncbi:MAG: DUF2239 family protein [Thermoanaerobaculia bacterium]